MDNWTTFETGVDATLGPYEAAGGEVPMAPVINRVLGAWDLKEALDPHADPFDRAAAADRFVGATVWGVADSLHLLSGGIGEAGAAAGAAASIAGFFSMAGLVMGQFTIMGLPYHEAAVKTAAEGLREGRNLGFAAGATGADKGWVKDKLDVYRHMEGGDLAQRAGREAYSKGLWDGYRAGAGLSSEAKKQYVDHVIRVAVESHISLNMPGDQYEHMVFVFARAAETATQLLSPELAHPEHQTPGADPSPAEPALPEAAAPHSPPELAHPEHQTPGADPSPAGPALPEAAAPHPPPAPADADAGPMRDEAGQPIGSLAPAPTDTPPPVTDTPAPPPPTDADAGPMRDEAGQPIGSSAPAPTDAPPPVTDTPAPPPPTDADAGPMRDEAGQPIGSSAPAPTDAPPPVTDTPPPVTDTPAPPPPPSPAAHSAAPLIEQHQQHPVHDAPPPDAPQAHG